MIGRKPQDEQAADSLHLRGFDDFELKLGDTMRGERATLGKSLLDVQRELRIKASYIAAIENCDPSAFDTPGFIAGYVRSYARYLGMDPESTFTEFCAESGFSTAHGMSSRASVLRTPAKSEPRDGAGRDPFLDSNFAYSPVGDSLLSRIEPAAVGSVLVLLALIGGIGYGGWSVLKEVQRVQLVPVDQTPLVLSDLDPLEPALAPAAGDDAADDGDTVQAAGLFNPPSNEALDRLYRPQALDVPVLVARDAPISTLDPDTVGAFAAAAPRRLPDIQRAPRDAVAQALAAAQPGPFGPDSAAPTVETAAAGGMPKVLEDGAPGVTMIAVRPAWVRVRAADGSVVYETIMNAGDTFEVPRTEEPPTLRVGESGAVYFTVAGQTYGPVGETGSVTSNVALSVDNLTGSYAVADLMRDADLQRVVAELGADLQSDQSASR